MNKGKLIGTETVSQARPRDLQSKESIELIAKLHQMLR